jgi:hypothetical protein
MSNAHYTYVQSDRHASAELQRLSHSANIAYQKMLGPHGTTADYDAWRRLECRRANILARTRVA